MFTVSMKRLLQAASLILISASLVHSENCIEYPYPSTAGNQVNNSSSSNQNSWQQTLCGGVYQESDEFVISSPGYPGGYPARSDCVYRLQGPQCQRKYRFEILDFSVERSLGCEKDRLEVQDLDALCGVRQGTKEYQSRDGQLRLRFISDSDTGGRGFRILVTRLPCEYFDNNSGTTIIPLPIYPPPTTARPPPIYPTQPPYPGPGPTPFCCAKYYNSRHFIIASPEFPRSGNVNANCVYQIYRANPNICRLRMNFHFFHIGSDTSYAGQGYPGNPQSNLCRNGGYLEIDGKRLCGCRTGLNLVSNFDPSWGERPKTIHFRNILFSPQFLQQQGNSYSGFAIEVIQDECPNRYDVTGRSNMQIPLNWLRSKRENPVEPSRDHRSYANDEISFPWRIGSLPFIRERTEILDDFDNTAGINSPNTVKHLYFFKAPEDNSDEVYNPFSGGNTEKEPTTYLDTSDTETNSAFWSGPQSGYRCSSWGFVQYTLLTKHPLWHLMPRCGSNQLIPLPEENRCRILSELRGTVQSPGFPMYYPGNLNICYRFTKQFGYCGVKLTMTDFKLEDSRDCVKDYVSFNGGQFKYCGNSLQGTVSTFNLANKAYEELHFVSDSYYCERGFRGIYEQVACESTPQQPQQPFPPTPGVPQPPQCGGDVDADFYIVEVPWDATDCAYKIYRSSQGVCRVQMSFLSFDLACGQGRILINGQEYCGTLTGRKIFVDFNSFNQLSVIYHKEDNLRNPLQSRSPIRIAVSQIRAGCDPFSLDIPAERRLTLCPSQDTSNLTGIITVIPRTHKDDDEVNNDKCGHSVIRRREGICELQLNLSNINVVESKDCLQSFISLNNQRACGFKNQVLEVEFTNATLDVWFKLNNNETEYIEFNQIICDSRNSSSASLGANKATNR